MFFVVAVWLQHLFIGVQSLFEAWRKARQMKTVVQSLFELFVSDCAFTATGAILKIVWKSPISFCVFGGF